LELKSADDLLIYAIKAAERRNNGSADDPRNQSRGAAQQ
jgi:hypothetical protein